VVEEGGGGGERFENGDDKWQSHDTDARHHPLSVQFNQQQQATQR
jgi:hypothetical protein